MVPDPEQVAAKITGCHEHILWPGWCARHRFVGHGGVESGRWPCSVLTDATEVVRAAFKQVWDDGNDRCLDTNPYEKEEQ